MMVCGFEFTDIDRSNKDVGKIVEFFNKKFNAQNEEIAQLQGRIKQLGGEVPQTKSRKYDVVRNSQGCRS